MRGGARQPHARRTPCTLSVRPRAPTKQMGLFPQPASASGTDGRALERHTAGTPHQVEREINQLGGAVGVRLGPDADEAGAQAALERAEPLPLQAIERVTGRMRLRDHVARELAAPLVVVALRAREI